MVGVAKSYCRTIVESPAYQALLKAVATGDKAMVDTQVAAIDRMVEDYSVRQFNHMFQHDLDSELNAKKAPDWWKRNWDLSELGSFGRALEEFLGLRRPTKPSNLASEAEFFYAMQRQALRLLPEWYERTDSPLRDLSLLETVH